jgi:ribosomal protein S18 acetylase RimI-like enzyme
MNEGRTEIAIRRGIPRDRTFVLDLGKRVAATSISALRPVALGAVEDAFERLTGFVYGRRHEVLVAHDGERRLGFLLLLLDLPDEVTSGEQAFIAYMAVEPDERGRGVGEALVRGAEELARALGFPHLSLMVTEDNGPAQRLYARAGLVTERRMLTKQL